MSEDSGQWQARLLDMEAWYSELASDEAVAVKALQGDYEPYRSVLSAMRGDVIDIGGGAGLAAGYLTSARSYLVVDPSTSWQTPRWDAIRAGMGASAPTHEFRPGVGEALPIDGERFDSALLLWSLNHASDPERVISEVKRVMRPGGQVLLVLEDMVPTTLDMPMMAIRSLFWRLSGGRHLEGRWPYFDIPATRRYLERYWPGPWPLQADHIRVDEKALRSWFADRFVVRERWWQRRFLSYVLEAL